MSNKLFVNLHAHSVFSIGDSLCSPEDMVKQAKKLGMDAISITDHGTLAGHLQFRDACRKHGIKPIFGNEFYFVDDVHDIFVIKEQVDLLQDEIKKISKDKTKKAKKLAEEKSEVLEELRTERNRLKKYNHLIILAENAQGYDNLMKLHNDSVIDGVYFKPRIDFATLEKHRGGLIASSACLGGRLCKLLEKDDIEGAKENLARFKSIFGPDNFFIELQLHDIQLQTETNGKLIKLAEATETPLVITCDSHYTEAGQGNTRALIRQLDKEPDEINNDDVLTSLYIKNEDMLLNDWRKYMPEHSIDVLVGAITNTRRIADRVQVFPFDTSLKFPTFETHGLTQETFLERKAWEGLVKRGFSENPTYVSRLKFELNTVNKLGFASYFNVVGDIINHAKKSQPVGLGRGSAGGSLLSFCLGITNINPIEYGLFFERFLDAGKGLQAPTFGLELSEVTYDYQKIVESCECHKH